MKVLIVLSVFAALAYGEPPIYRQQNQQQRRYYFARQEEQTTLDTPTEAPYPPAGWKPDGPSFDLPQKQVKDSYAPPASFGSRTSDSGQQYAGPFTQAQAQPQQNQQQQQQQRFGSFEFQARQQEQQRQFEASQNQFKQRQYLAPAVQPPINQYGAPETQGRFQPPQPDQEYGAPVATTTEEPATTTETEDSTTTSAPQTDSEVEPVNSVNELDDEGDLDEQQQQQERQRGQYYVALPDGRLQRIQYVSHEDVEAMKYFARISAENVEPLRGPIYSYSPLQQLQFAQTNLRLVPSPAQDSSSASSASSASSGSSTSSAKTVASGKHELQEEVAPSLPLAAVVQYTYDAPSAVIPLGGASSGFSANYRAPAPEQRYFITF